MEVRRQFSYSIEKYMTIPYKILFISHLFIHLLICGHKKFSYTYMYTCGYTPTHIFPMCSLTIVTKKVPFPDPTSPRLNMTLTKRKYGKF